MKLATALTDPADAEFEVFGGLESAQATLIGDASIFNILSRIYSRPIEAVIRETACNARDAHIDAGTADRPFDVILPTRMKAEFAIRDYGTGLNKDDVLKLFTCFGYSTKKASEDTVGFFGIGSKAFFAVTDQATITSWHGGKRYMFSFAKDAQDKPVMTLMDEVDSIEPTGLRIAYPVPEGRVDEYRDAAEIVFARWPAPVPNFIGFEDMAWRKVKYMRETPGLFGLRDHRSGGTFRPDGPFAIMGSIAYPIDTDLVPEASDLSYVPVDFFFNLGEIKPSPSRESIEYTPAVIEAITRRIHDMRNTLKAEIEAAWEGVTSLFDAIDKQGELSPVLSSLPTAIRSWVLPKGLTYQGVSVPMSKDFVTLSHTSQRWSVIPQKAAHLGELTATMPKRDRDRWVGDRGSFGRTLYLSNPTSVICVSATDNGLQTYNKLVTIKDRLHEQLVLFYEEPTDEALRQLKVYGVTDAPIWLKDVPAPKLPPTLRPRTKLKRWEGEGWKEAEIDFDAGGVYVDLSGGMAELRGLKYHKYSFRSLLGRIRNANITPPEIYGVPQSLQTRFQKHKRLWVNLETWLKAEILKVYTPTFDHDLEQARQIRASHWTKLANIQDQLPPRRNLKLLCEALAWEKTFREQTQPRHVNHYTGELPKLAAEMGIVVPQKAGRDRIHVLESLDAKYPLGRLVLKNVYNDVTRGGADTVRDLIDYLS